MCIQLCDCANPSVSPAPATSAWYAVYTYPRHEKTVARYLDDQSFEIFLPLFTITSQWKDRRVRITQPLFPGYVFTRISLDKRVGVLGSPGVIRIVSFNGIPAPIDEAEIAAVRRCVTAVTIQPHPFLAIGERVRVREGVFEGVEGIVLRRNNRCKLVVSLGLIGQGLAFEIESEQLESLTPKDRHDFSPTASRPAPCRYSC